MLKIKERPWLGWVGATHPLLKGNGHYPGKKDAYGFDDEIV